MILGTHHRRARTPAGALLLLLATACTAGDGVGSARGPLYIRDCINRGGELIDLDGEFDLQPQFFAGEPIEDVSQGRKSNRLLIRMQRSGKRFELNDTVMFDVTNSYEVARCLRGRRDENGAPDFDARHCVQTSDGPRVRVAPDAYVRGHLLPRSTCNRTVQGISVATVQGVAVSPRTTDAEPPVPIEGSDVNFASYIDFTHFGGALRPDITDPAQRPPVSEQFRVDFDERIKAERFRLNLEDQRVTDARTRRLPLPSSDLRGTLEGFFDFDLERGQGAQSFP